jgi:hypothetical protein
MSSGFCRKSVKREIKQEHAARSGEDGALCQHIRELVYLPKKTDYTP